MRRVGRFLVAMSLLSGTLACGELNPVREDQRSGAAPKEAAGIGLTLAANSRSSALEPERVKQMSADDALGSVVQGQVAAGCEAARNDKLEAMPDSLYEFAKGDDAAFKGATISETIDADGTVTVRRDRRGNTLTTKTDASGKIVTSFFSLIKGEYRLDKTLRVKRDNFTFGAQQSVLYWLPDPTLQPVARRFLYPFYVERGLIPAPRYAHRVTGTIRKGETILNFEKAVTNKPWKRGERLQLYNIDNVKRPSEIKASTPKQTVCADEVSADGKSLTLIKCNDATSEIMKDWTSETGFYTLVRTPPGEMKAVALDDQQQVAPITPETKRLRMDPDYVPSPGETIWIAAGVNVHDPNDADRYLSGKVASVDGGEFVLTEGLGHAIPDHGSFKTLKTRLIPPSYADVLGLRLGPWGAYHNLPGGEGAAISRGHGLHHGILRFVDGRPVTNTTFQNFTVATCIADTTPIDTSKVINGARMFFVKRAQSTTIQNVSVLNATGDAVIFDWHSADLRVKNVHVRGLGFQNYNFFEKAMSTYAIYAYGGEGISADRLSIKGKNLNLFGAEVTPANIALTNVTVDTFMKGLAPNKGAVIAINETRDAFSITNLHLEKNTGFAFRSAVTPSLPLAGVSFASARDGGLPDLDARGDRLLGVTQVFGKTYEPLEMEGGAAKWYTARGFVRPSAPNVYLPDGLYRAAKLKIVGNPTAVTLVTRRAPPSLCGLQQHFKAPFTAEMELDGLQVCGKSAAHDRATKVIGFTFTSPIAQAMPVEVEIKFQLHRLRATPMVLENLWDADGKPIVIP